MNWIFIRNASFWVPPYFAKAYRSPKKKLGMQRKKKASHVHSNQNQIKQISLSTHTRCQRHVKNRSKEQCQKVSEEANKCWAKEIGQRYPFINWMANENLYWLVGGSIWLINMQYPFELLLLHIVCISNLCVVACKIASKRWSQRVVCFDRVALTFFERNYFNTRTATGKYDLLFVIRRSSPNEEKK